MSTSMPATDAMIRTEDLTKYFDDFLAVKEVNLEIRAGEVLALLGPNGAGKTTTVRMLSSILVPSSGRAWVAGYDVVADPAKVRAAVGVLTENHGLYNRMFADEYLTFFGKIYRLDGKTLKAQSQKLLGDFGLLEAKDRRIGEFSKGMRQKLALARALLHSPQVLLLDEPTSAMDPESARLVRNSIIELRSADRAIIICTHNLAEAEELADKIAVIRNGQIIAQGSPAEMHAQFLGSPEYEVRFAGGIYPEGAALPGGANLTIRGPGWLQYKTNDPERVNPAVLKELMNQGFQIVSLQATSRSLEEVYLRVIALNTATAKTGER